MTGCRQGGSPLWLEHLQILFPFFFFFFSLLSFSFIHPMLRICLYIRGCYVFFISYLSSSASKFFPFLHSIQFLVFLFSFIFSVLCLFAPHLSLTPPPFCSPLSSGLSRIPIPYPSVCQCLNHSSLSSLSLSFFPRRPLLVFRSRFHFTTDFLLLFLSGDIHSNPGPVSSTSTLTFSCLNSRSVSSISPLPDKPAFLQEFISDHSIDILAVTETWLTPATLPSTLNSLTPPGYSILRSPRPVGTGGGLALLFRSFLKISSISLPLFSSFESAAYRVTFASSFYIFLLIYRPPPKTKPINLPTAGSNSFSSFFTDFSLLLEDLVSSPSELIITGDFNLHLDDSSCSKSTSFLSLLHTFDLTQLVSFPTHSDGHTLDLLITRASSSILSNIDYSSLPSSFSDHSAILSSLTIPSSSRPPSIIKVIRNTKSIHIPSFSNDILSSPLFTTSPHSLSSYLDLSSSTISLLLDKHAPSKTITCSSKIPKPFITPAILKQKSIRSRLEAVYRRCKSELNKLNFRRQVNLVSKLITLSRRPYFRNLITQTSKDPKKLWSSIDSLLSRKSVPPLPPSASPSLLATSFLNFSVDKILKLTSSFSSSSLPFSSPPLPPPTPPPSASFI